MKIEPRTLKGFRDFLPKDARKRQYVIEALKSVFESYGFEPLETPALEYEDILLGKYGEEGDKLMYRFEDNGQRRVALRYDQTVPLARVVAQYENELPLPFKRYQISSVWRAENTQKGRFREFLQCDIDIVGSTSPSCDAETIQIAISSLQKLGFKNFKILVNDRSLFGEISKDAVISIDKLKKIGEEKVKEELSQKGIDPKVVDEIKRNEPTDSLEKMIDLVNDERVVFEPTLARGLDYYTGLIIEVEIEGYSAGSVGGGGRYDNLIGMFAGKQIPAVGFAFGFDRLLEAMGELNLFPDELDGKTKVLVTIPSIELEKTSMEIANILRKSGINTESWLDETKMDRQFKYAEKKEIPYVVVPLDSRTVELRTKSQAGEIVKKIVEINSLPNEIV